MKNKSCWRCWWQCCDCECWWWWWRWSVAITFRIVSYLCQSELQWTLHSFPRVVIWLWGPWKQSPLKFNENTLIWSVSFAQFKSPRTLIMSKDSEWPAVGIESAIYQLKTSPLYSPGYCFHGTWTIKKQSLCNNWVKKRNRSCIKRRRISVSWPLTSIMWLTVKYSVICREDVCTAEILRWFVK